MIDRELEARIRRLFHVEKWKVGTIAEQLGIHHSVVRRVLDNDGLPRPRSARPSRIDPYLPFILDTLRRYPRVPASRLYDMCRERGYRGSPDHFRHLIARHRPKPPAEAYQRMRTLPGEQAQVDWAHFGRVKIGRAERALLAFVVVLSFSRQVFLRFYFGQHAENFLRGHEAAFAAWGGVTRVLLYDNLKSAVLDRRGDAIAFNPLLIDFANHYRFEPQAAAPYRGNEKGRVERAIRFVRTSFWPARTWRDIDDLNDQAWQWCHGRAAERPWPDDRSKTVAEAFAEEKSRLLPLPETSFATEERREIKVGKTPYARFDGNDYSVPHDLVRRTLEVRATLERVRVLHRGEVVAEHPRSFDRGQLIEDRAHIEALRKVKGEVRRHRSLDRLTRAAPSSQEFFVQLAQRGENLGRMTQLVLRLLDEYGAVRLEQAIREALAAGTLHYHALRQILERVRRDQGLPPPTTIDLPDDRRVRDLAVSPHDLGSYDDLLGEVTDDDQDDDEEEGEGHATAIR